VAFGTLVVIICQTMVVLALDTTTSSGSCALVRDDRLVREEASDQSRPQAARLPGELAAMLEREGVALSEVDALAVGIGPGSFTGLRVGIATMQGLAMALKRPLFGVSAFDALASIAWGGSGVNSEPDPPHVQRNGQPDASLVRGAGAAKRTRHEGLYIATWVDAWRGEVYAALYQDGREIEPPTVDLPEHLLRTFAGLQILFTGDGAAICRAAISTGRASAGWRDGRARSRGVPGRAEAATACYSTAICSTLRCGTGARPLLTMARKQRPT
jgi:tRNA threonylcarbamoyl adenosine modification protein YeaZ